MEKRAAELLRNKIEAEPTRSVLYRSAACLALRCGYIYDAAALACHGLSGNPPNSVREELFDVINQVLRRKQ